MLQAEHNAKTTTLEPIGTALERASVELEAVVQMIIDLEDVVGHAISSAKSTRELQIEELQQLDRARQKVEGAAEFLHALTLMLPEQWRIDAGHAARSVAMTELAHRLAGLAPHVTPPAPEAYELF